VFKASTVNCHYSPGDPALAEKADL